LSFPLLAVITALTLCSDFSDHYTSSKGYIMISNFFFFRKSCRSLDNVENVEKHCRAGQATDGNEAHANCMLDTKGYKHTIRICNTAFPLQQWLSESA
jgi:hypothetical protein